MSARANYFKIGLFVITGTVIAVAAVIILGVGAIFQQEILVESYFEDSVQGLDVGSPVKFRGVQIGKVDKIGLASLEYETDRRYVLIRMALSSDVFLVKNAGDAGEGLEGLIRDGLRVRLNFQGVTGTAYIEADYLDPERYPRLEFEWDPEYPYIPSAPSIITRLTDSLDQLMRNFEGLSSSIQESLVVATRVLEEANVARIGEDAGMLLQEMRATNQEIKNLVLEIDAETLTSEAGATLRETRRLVNDMRPKLDELLRTSLGAVEKINRVAGELEESGDLSASLARLQRASRRLDNLLAGQEVEIETIIRNFRVLSENFREVSEELEKSPRKFLFGGPPPRTQIGGE